MAGVSGPGGRRTRQRDHDRTAKAAALARLVYREATDITEEYKQKMDLGDDLPADRVDGVPPSSSLGQDGPVSERLKLVSVALRSLHVLLGAVVLEQQEEFSPTDGPFHSKLEALLSRLGDLSDGLGLLLLETGGVTTGDKDAPPSSPSASSSSSFSRKVRGYCVLRELSAWVLRAHQELRSGGAGTGGNAEGSGAPGGRRALARRLRHRRI